MNQFARPSLSSSNSDAPGADARLGAGVKSARVLFKRATAPRLTLRRAPERFCPVFVSEATAREGRRVVLSCAPARAADGSSAAHTETANRRQIRSVERRGLRVARRDDEAERFFMGTTLEALKLENHTTKGSAFGEFERASQSLTETGARLQLFLSAIPLRRMKRAGP